MAELKFKTIGNENPQGKQRVYFSCHPRDFEKYFESVSEEILRKQNCAVYYYEPEDEVPEKELELTLSQVQLLAVAVTAKFLSGENRALSAEFKYAAEHNIPVLPLMQESGLAAAFNSQCGDLQFLDKYASDPTAISYDEKLEKFLKSVLVSDELAQKVRKAFDAYIFLSYRKKDRKYAQELMRLIHKNDFCRDIAIWYDEFLVPGENFNDAIEDAMKKSKLFTMVVTPNLVNEKNYVMTTEYPMAKKEKKEILPVESVKTDIDKLRENFEDIKDYVKANDEAGLSEALIKNLQGIAIRKNDSLPEHNFFIGLAYLSGIDVEVNHERAVELITSAAEAGLEAAMEKLVFMYRNGEGVKRDYEAAVKWLLKLIEIYEDRYGESHERSDESMIITMKEDLVKLYKQLDDYEKAISIAEDMINNSNAGLYPPMYNLLAGLYADNGRFEDAEQLYYRAFCLYEKLSKAKFNLYEDGLTASYFGVGDLLEKKGDFVEAAKIYLRVTELKEQLSEKDYVSKQADFFNCYVHLGRVYNELSRYEESQQMYLKAVEISEELKRIKPDVYNDSSFLGVYNGLGVLYSRLNRFADCEQMFLKVLEIRTELSKENPELYGYDLSMAYNNLAVLYDETLRHDKAEEMYLKVYEIRRRLCIKNPSVYEPKLASVCNNLGVLYKVTSKYAKAERMHLIALEIRERLYGENPDVYEPELAESSSGLATVYSLMGRNNEAERMFVTSITLRRRLAKKNPDAYEPMLAAGYNNLGSLYNLAGRYEEAERMYTKALEIREKLAENTPEAYLPDCAELHKNMAIMYKRMGRKGEAKSAGLKALDIYKKLGGADNIKYKSAVKECCEILNISNVSDGGGADEKKGIMKIIGKIFKRTESERY